MSDWGFDSLTGHLITLSYPGHIFQFTKCNQNAGPLAHIYERPNVTQDTLPGLAHKAWLAHNRHMTKSERYSRIYSLTHDELLMTVFFMQGYIGESFDIAMDSAIASLDSLRKPR